MDISSQPEILFVSFLPELYLFITITDYINKTFDKILFSTLKYFKK